ncbi:hypothetical protein [Nocardia sp. NPDC024068]|uniref:hypothetical protein n=1 Tax=Nocardia sp. NPDC024068 TaxID=3157197 RepID=UPI0033CE17ED
MNIALENFILYGVSDDWAPVAEFDSTMRRLAGPKHSRGAVVQVIRELADRGLIEIGAFPGGNRAWELWRVPLDESIYRIQNGYNGERGYLDIPESEIGSNEVFRARLTESGQARLATLGDPYETYGDPWFDDPLVKAEGDYRPFRGVEDIFDDGLG